MTDSRHLLTGPAGSGKSHAALARIRDAATESGPRGRHQRRTARALLVLPTYAQVRHAQRIALSRWDARAMLDAPFATFTSAGEQFLSQFRVRTLPSAVERDRLVAQALDDVAPTVFDQAGDAPGLRARILRLVKELKQTGRDGPALRAHLAERLDALAPNARDRTAAFLQVFAAYEQRLREAGFEDHEDVLRRLAESLEQAQPERLPSVLAFDGFDDFTAIEHRILEALARHVSAAGGEVLVTLPYDAARPHLFEGSAPTRARLLAAGFREQVLDELPRFAAPALAHLARDLFAAPPAAPLDTQAVRTLVGGDPDDEAECVARAVRALGRHRPTADGKPAGWRQVGIVLRNVVADGPRVQAALQRLGVPARMLQAGPALTSVPWVVALDAALHVLRGETDAGRFEARRVRAWLRWCLASRGDVVAQAAWDAWDLSHRRQQDPATWPAFVRQAPPVLREELQALDDAAAALRAAPDAAACYQQLARWIEALVPLPRGGGLSADGTVRDRAADARRQQAAQARRLVQSMLDGLATSAQRDAAETLDVAEAVDVLEATWVDATLPQVDRRLDAVNLLDPLTARYWELDHVFVVGLAEGAFPVRPREDVLLRDADRDALHDGDPALRLPRARDREVRERRLFYGAVTRARQVLWLSRPAYDAEGNPLQPSVYWDVVHTHVTPAIEHESSGPGRAAWPEVWTFTAGDLARRAAVLVERDPTFAREVFAQLADDPRPRARAHTRGAPAAVTAPDVPRRFRESVACVDVSALNQARRCSYRHFARRILGVRADDLSFEGPTFGYREEGQALHDAFHDALRTPDRPSSDIAAQHADVAGADPAVRALLARELTRAIDLLRAREHETAGAFAPVPRGLEYTFGEAEPVVLGAGEETFRLRGRVDRIDARADGALVLVDYKRSASGVARAQKEAEQAYDLQLPLYARALEVSWDTRVVGLEWMAALTRDRRAVWSAPASAALAVRREGVKPTIEDDVDFRARLARTEATAAATVARARAGAFDRRPLDATLCDTCDWRPICRPDPAWVRREVTP